VARENLGWGGRTCASRVLIGSLHPLLAMSWHRRYGVAGSLAG
jgi:hypothetical protein